MALKPLRPCRHPGCAALTREGYCPKHKPQKAPRRVSAEYHSWYSLPIWTDDLRPAQLLREPFCRECAVRGVRTRATVVDHITPHRGDWAKFVDPANHQSLCKPCHDRKTALEMAEERRKNHGIFDQDWSKRVGTLGRGRAWACVPRHARGKAEGLRSSPRPKKVFRLGANDRRQPSIRKIFPMRSLGNGDQTLAEREPVGRHLAGKMCPTWTPTREVEKWLENGSPRIC